jgi:L-alanine-DL-glutamate epimerase-like enolase superfamily enzyme
MDKPTDISIAEVSLHFLPVTTRVPLKFGAEVLTEVICARVRMLVIDRQGRQAEGWGETPLNIQWAWPGTLSYAKRCSLVKEFCVQLGHAWAAFENQGHPLEISYDFQEQILPALLTKFNCQRQGPVEPMPRLAGLVCCSAFDLALHDAYGHVHGCPVYETYNSAFMNRNLADFLSADPDFTHAFQGKYPADFLVQNPASELVAWHLVGGLDCLQQSELTGSEPDDGYPVALTDWIERDQLKCLKVKLRGNDAEWDFQRLVTVGEIAVAAGAQWLSADFNCTVSAPAYVNEILDHLRLDFPQFFKMLLYVEQPFPYELEQHRIPAHSVSARKPLFLDESAHDWKLVKLGRELGWTGVALKTCKTQTGAILSGCWAKAHGLQVMVQDLTNPMLAQIPHALLAGHVGTIMGLETNAMQFYPEASAPEEVIHPGLYRRRNGHINLSSIEGPGFGYRLDEIFRELPAPVLSLSAGRPQTISTPAIGQVPI